MSSNGEESIISDASTKKCFLNRGDFMEHIKFPENSPSLIVIPSNKEGTGFLKYCYDERHLKGKITEEEFDNIVEAAAKISAKASSKKRIMDKKGIGRPYAGMISLCFLMSLSYIFLMLAAAHAESEVLHYLGYVLLIPSLIMMIFISIKNVTTNIKQFITFEEITKNDLDNYFEKINRETYSKRSLEWATAQLGHFWIELRIKNPNTRATLEEKPQPKNNAFVRNSSSSKNSEIERQESEENRLVDYNENEHFEKIQEKRSEISGLSEHYCYDPKCNHRKCGKIPKSSNTKLLAESIISDEDDKEEESNGTENEVFELIGKFLLLCDITSILLGIILTYALEDDQELENFKKSRSIDSQEKHKSRNSHQEQHKSTSQPKTKNVDDEDDGFGLEALDLLE